MLVNALDDLVMIRFKQGWFTLIKYEHQVGELKNPKPREELLEFIKKLKEEGDTGELRGLKKPETWISKIDMKIDNKFKKEAEGSTIKKASNDLDNPASVYANTVTPSKVSVTTGRPTSQSKVAQKRARQQAALKSGASGGPMKPGLSLPSFRKNLKLKLGGDAVDKDDNVPVQSAPGSNVKPIKEEISEPKILTLANNSPQKPPPLIEEESTSE